MKIFIFGLSYQKRKSYDIVHTIVCHPPLFCAPQSICLVVFFHLAVFFPKYNTHVDEDIFPCLTLFCPVTCIFEVTVQLSEPTYKNTGR